MRPFVVRLVPFAAIAALAGPSWAQSSKSHKEVALGIPYLGMQTMTTPLSQGGPGATMTAADQATERLDDERIVEILHVANTGEIEQSRIVAQRGSDPRVRRLAAQIQHDHEEADARRALTAKRRGLGTLSSSTSKKLDTQGQQILTDLRGKSGPELDRAYLSEQIDEHKKVLDIVDSSLAPRATNGDVQALVRDARPMLQHHLDALQALRSEVER